MCVVRCDWSCSWRGWVCQELLEELDVVKQNFTGFFSAIRPKIDSIQTSVGIGGTGGGGGGGAGGGGGGGANTPVPFDGFAE